MRISKEQKQEEKIFKLQQELDLSKKENKSLKNKLATSERKRKSLMGDRGKKTPYIKHFPSADKTASIY